MASAASEKEREFLRWKRRQDLSRAQKAAAKRMEQEQQQRQARGTVYPALKTSAVFADRAHGGLDDDNRPFAFELFGDESAFADAEPSPSRPFTGSEDDGADTEEDELMRMIMERERLEAEAEEKSVAAAAAAVRATRGGKPQRLFVAPPPRTARGVAAAAAQDEFYSPVRPADSENGSTASEQHRGHAPFRSGARVVTESHRYAKQRQPPPPPAAFGDQQHERQRQARFVNVHDQHSHRRQPQSDVTSNQVEHEAPYSVHGQQQSHQIEKGRRKREQARRVQSEDELWDHFLYGTSDVADAHQEPSPAHQQQHHRQQNIFREEISLSQSRSTSLDSGFATANESTTTAAAAISSQQQQRQHYPEGQSQPSGNYSNESIPVVSYSPPMSPAMGSSSARWRQSSSTEPNRYQQAPGGGAGDREGDRDWQQQRAPSSPTPVIFPFWSVAFLLSCLVVGVSGFFIEEVMDLVGKFSKRASTLSLSKHEQKQMQTRLEQLQSEIHGFRYTASEIESHSQRVFAEVKTHLDRMKSEREKHQEVIAKEMNDLRAYMLHMMSDMVEQERELIHTRLKHVATGAAVEKGEEKDDALPAADERIEDTVSDDGKEKSDSSTQSVEQPAQESVVPHQSLSPPEISSAGLKMEAPPAVVVREAVGNATPLPEPAVPPEAALSRGEGVMLMSWELLMMLAAMSLLGGFVGLRVRNLNRRKRWHEQRRIKRQIHEQLEQERAQRVFEEDDEEEEADDESSEGSESESDELGEGDGEDTESRTDGSESEGSGWDDGATESSIETVSLMRLASGLTPQNSKLRAPSSDGGDEDGDDFEEGKGDGEEEEVPGTPARKKTVRYSFVREDGDLAQSPSSSRRRSPRLETRVQRH